MSLSRSVWFLTALCSVTLASPVQASADDKSSHAGFVKVDWSRVVGDKEPSVQIVLERPLLKMMAAAAKENDEDIVDIVNQLSFVRVNVYEGVTGDPEKIAKAVDSQVSTLLENGWTSVAKVRDGDADSERVDVLMKANEDTIVGFAIFVAGSEDLVFVNIAGDMEPETFGAKLGSIVGKLSGGELNLENMAGMLDSIKVSASGEKKDDDGEE